MGVTPLVKLLHQWEAAYKAGATSAPQGGKMNSHDQAALLQDALLSFVTHVSSFLKLLVTLMASSALMKDDFYFFLPEAGGLAPIIHLRCAR